MKEKMQMFWASLLQKINGKINQWLNKRTKSMQTLDAGDDTVVNFFLMVLQKVVNRVLMGAEYSVESDSAIAEPLKDLCADVQENVYGIVGNMLGNSTHAECWVVPAFVTVGGVQKLIHSYVSGEKICITQTREDGGIAECDNLLDIVLNIFVGPVPAVQGHAILNVVNGGLGIRCVRNGGTGDQQNSSQEQDSQQTANGSQNQFTHRKTSLFLIKKKYTTFFSTKV